MWIRENWWTLLTSIWKTRHCRQKGFLICALTLSWESQEYTESEWLTLDIFLHLLWQVNVVKWGEKKYIYSDFRNFADIFWWRKGGGILNKNRSFCFGSNCYLCVLLDIFNYTWCFLFCSDLLLRHALSVAFASYPQHMLSWVSFCWINAYCFRAAQFTHTKSHHDLL